MNIKTLISLLLIFIPISIVAELSEWGTVSIFVTSALAIIPLSIWLSTAVEKISILTGPNIGALVYAVFGCSGEVIVAFVALKKGLISLVKASITGNILSNLLLFIGLAMLTAGIRHKELDFKTILPRVNGSSMTLAVTAIALPSVVIYTSRVVDMSAIRNLSIVAATVLIIVYGLTLLFSFKTHKYLYDMSLEAEKESDSSASKLENSDWRTSAFWIFILLLSTIGVVIESEIFVSVINPAMDQFGITPLFTGVIVLPLITNVAEILTVIRLAFKNEMDLTISLVTGDSLLFALFVAPVLVLVGQFITQYMDLNFNPFEVVALIVAVAFTNLVSLSGRGNWLDGVFLLATYIILAFAFYYHPA